MTAVIISVPCICVLIAVSSQRLSFQIALAIFTGVTASSLVSIFIEMSNNYRRNYQRLLVLHEYLDYISGYEDLVGFCMFGYTGGLNDAGENSDSGEVSTVDRKFSAGNDETDLFSPKWNACEQAVSEIVLEKAYIIEDAYKSGREYMSLNEVTQCMLVIEAAEKIRKIAEELINENLKSNATRTELYDCLDEPFRTEVTDFADEVGIAISDDDLKSIVADYMLTHNEDLDDNTRLRLRYALISFDEGMKKLRKIAKCEPDYFRNLVPADERFERASRKIRKESGKVDERIYQKLAEAVKKGNITESEYEEFLELEEKEISVPIDDSEEAMETFLEAREKEHSRVLRRAFEIMKKAGV